MKLALLCLLCSTAYAERTTMVTLGATLDARGTDATWDAAGKKDSTLLGGARLTLSFEDAPLPIPPLNLIDHDVRLAPELFAGFYADDRRAEGYIGAGARGELFVASNMRGWATRMAIYVAARGVIIGKHQDAAPEFALGEYMLTGNGTRLGWEGAAMIRQRPHADPAQSKELDALVSIYVAWR